MNLQILMSEEDEEDARANFAISCDMYADTLDQELAEEVINSIFRQIYVPFFTLYTMLVIIPAIAVMVFIIKGVLPLPLWCVLLNPVVFQIIGFILRATKLKIFIDAPSCCAASLGLAAYGVLALISL